MVRSQVLVVLVLAIGGCMPYPNARRLSDELVPAVEYSRAVKAGKSEDFTIFNVAERTFDRQNGVVDAEASGKSALMAPDARAAFGGSAGDVAQPALDVRQLEYQGDNRYLNQGWRYQRSVGSVSPSSDALLESAGVESALPAAVHARNIPGSSAPYYQGQMTSNPSLWPDESQGTSLFRDIRAFQSMDIVTIILNEKSEGQKKADTSAESSYSLVAAIKNFFGQEETWKANNLGLDPSNLINAETDSKYEGKGETKRAGTLRAKMSAMVLEVLPNGLLRLEGTKIISVDHEEEIMVISGLVRTKDIDAANQVDSSRIANMRVDFYGRGVLGENTFPGWFARLVRNFWPF